MRKNQQQLGQSSCKIKPRIIKDTKHSHDIRKQTRKYRVYCFYNFLRYFLRCFRVGEFIQRSNLLSLGLMTTLKKFMPDHGKKL